MKYVDCKTLANGVLWGVANMETGRLTIITVGEDPASQSYVRGKIKDCERCGVPYNHVKILYDNGDRSEQYREQKRHELIGEIQKANEDDSVVGVILQLPLPESFCDWGESEDTYTNMIHREKDVDGLREGSPFTPCTPAGILHVIETVFGFRHKNLNTLIIGRGKLVGKPLAEILLGPYRNHTVTVAHSGTRDLDALISSGLYDVIVAAAGRRNLVNLQKCKARLVIDVGVNRDEGGRLCGDCWNFDPDVGDGMLVTPVPGGIGLMTRAMLMLHVACATGHASHR